MCDDAKNDAAAFVVCWPQTKLCEDLSTEEGKGKIHVVDCRKSSDTSEK